VTFNSTVAVSNVSLSVDYGETHVVLGPNGAGKTTTVETLLGFRTPRSGQVRLVGLDPISHHRDVVERVGALLQGGGVWFSMSPRDVLKLTSSYYGAPRPVDELIDALGLARCSLTPWRRLSGGEQQRTLLALALVGRPKVLILDEPTSAVDPEGHHTVRDLLRREKERGCALLITTHQLQDAEILADRVTILDQGEVVATGTPDELSGAAVLTFQSSVPLDAAQLALALDAAVEELDDNRYRCGAANSSSTMTTLQRFIDAAGGELVSLTTPNSLEDSYLHLLNRHRERRHS
jgi:ABC-2 type transport system ATP-binding protein